MISGGSYDLFYMLFFLIIFSSYCIDSGSLRLGKGLISISIQKLGIIDLQIHWS